MSESKIKAPRKAPTMGPKGWLHKSQNISGKQTAEGFLMAHRAFLEASEIAPAVSPVLAMVDSRDMLPTPALDLIQNLMLGYILDQEIQKGEAAMSREQSSGGTRKPWKATIFDVHDQVVTVTDPDGDEKELIKGFTYAQEADRWSKRRLFEAEPGSYAIVNHTVITIKGEPLSTRIDRDGSDGAMTAALPRAKHPFTKNTGSKSGRLSFGVKATTTHVTFSHG